MNLLGVCSAGTFHGRLQPCTLLPPLPPGAVAQLRVPPAPSPRPRVLSWGTSTELHLLGQVRQRERSPESSRPSAAGRGSPPLCWLPSLKEKLISVPLAVLSPSSLSDKALLLFPNERLLNPQKPTQNLQFFNEYFCPALRLLLPKGGQQGGALSPRGCAHPLCPCCHLQGTGRLPPAPNAEPEQP